MKRPSSPDADNLCNLTDQYTQVMDGSYQPRPVRRVVIPKPHGKGERKLGVPCVIDRVIQQAILQVLTPIFDPGFSESSFGSRPKRSAHGAIRQVKTVVKAGYRCAVDLDLEKFFYMDDLVILVKSRRAGRRVMAKISCYLTQKLKLKVNREKSRVAKIEDLEYLGFTFRGIRIFAAHQALKDFKHRLKGLTSRSWGVSMAERIERLNRYLRGWMNYFGISKHYSPIEELDSWLRRRIRMCYWKQWRRPRTRIANLLKLGTSKRQAILTGISRKGYWRLSKTLATHTGMTNEWLEQQGLLSIRTLWMKVQGYA